MLAVLFLGSRRWYVGTLGGKSQSPVTVIFEVETIAAVLGMLLWSHAFKGRLGHLFSDNEGTKFCLLRGVSDNACVNMSTQIFARHGMNSKALTWISRAASHRIL